MRYFCRAFCLTLLLFAAPARADAPPTAPARPVTGVIGAMRVEVELLERQMPDRQAETVGGISFVRGTLCGRAVVVAESGVGKVNAAMTAALLAERYHPAEVLFTGIAGGLAPDLRPGDIVIATRTAQHDAGVVTDEGFTPDRVTDPRTGARTPVFEEADGRLLAAARAVAGEVRFEPVRAGGAARKPVVRSGVVVSGDVFVASAKRAAELRRDFGADAVEMEGAAVARVCRAMDVPCLVIRSISDNADAAAAGDEAGFAAAAAANSASLVKALVARLAGAGAEPATRPATTPARVGSP